MGLLDKAVVIGNEASPTSSVCHPKVQIRSLFGCKISRVDTLSVFFDDYYFIFAAIFMIMGTFNIFYGVKWFKATIFLIGIISVVAFVFILLFFILEIDDLSQSMIWLCLLSSISIGSIVGYFLTKMMRIGVVVIGCWIGLILAFILDNMLFSYFNLQYFFYALAMV
jgi:hypothetical protein